MVIFLCAWFCFIFKYLDQPATEETAEPQPSGSNGMSDVSHVCTVFESYADNVMVYRNQLLDAMCAILCFAESNIVRERCYDGWYNNKEVESGFTVITN
jgi:hypothetical protein